MNVDLLEKLLWYDTSAVSPNLGQVDRAISDVRVGSHYHDRDQLVNYTRGVWLLDGFTACPSLESTVV